jgi:hypothetical protein
MEIVSIERKTFEAMVAKFDRFVHRMKQSASGTAKRE